jgi:hypothetical protein
MWSWRGWSRRVIGNEELTNEPWIPICLWKRDWQPVLNCSNRLKDWKPLRPGSVYVRRESSQCWSESLKQFERLKPHKYTRTWPTASCPPTPSTYFNDASMTQGSACQVLALVHRVTIQSSLGVPVVSFMMELILEWDATAIPCLATRNDMIWITGLCKEYWARYWQEARH